mmetsp:Transcript_15767/g.22517  ORF Transcript_15767/g.22517 Transcript_15767/m.22517 type:complete len:205 (+) Transcript_15767:136-750(+)
MCILGTSCTKLTNAFCTNIQLFLAEWDAVSIRDVFLTIFGVGVLNEIEAMQQCSAVALEHVHVRKAAERSIGKILDGFGSRIDAFTCGRTFERNQKNIGRCPSADMVTGETYGTWSFKHVSGDVVLIIVGGINAPKPFGIFRRISWKQTPLHEKFSISSGLPFTIRVISTGKSNLHRWAFGIKFTPQMSIILTITVKKCVMGPA